MHSFALHLLKKLHHLHMFIIFHIFLKLLIPLKNVQNYGGIATLHGEFCGLSRQSDSLFEKLCTINLQLKKLIELYSPYH
jgi:hypothetical protein